MRCLQVEEIRLESLEEELMKKGKAGQTRRVEEEMEIQLTMIDQHQPRTSRIKLKQPPIDENLPKLPIGPNERLEGLDLTRRTRRKRRRCRDRRLSSSSCSSFVGTCERRRRK